MARNRVKQDDQSAPLPDLGLIPTFVIMASMAGLLLYVLVAFGMLAAVVPMVIMAMLLKRLFGGGDGPGGFVGGGGDGDASGEAVADAARMDSCELIHAGRYWRLAPRRACTQPSSLRGAHLPASVKRAVKPVVPSAGAPYDRHRRSSRNLPWTRSNVARAHVQA